MAELTRKQKHKWSLIGGIAGFLVGGYMIFFLKNNWGFVPAIMGAVLLIFGERESRRRR